MSEEKQMVRPADAQLAARTRAHEFLKKRLPVLTEWAKGKLDATSLIRFAMVEWQQNAKLQTCSLDSLYLALVACAQVGLEPSGIKQEAYIVPYKGIATFVPGWRGLIKLARRSREVRAVRSHLVYQGDHFEPQLGSDERVVHTPAFLDRGELLGAYALAKMDNGEIEVEIMTLDELKLIRDKAKRGDYESPAYRDWAEQMYRKAPIRRLCKRLPLGEDYFRAAHLDELLEGGDVRAYQKAIDADSAELLPSAAPEPVETATRGLAGAKAQLAKRRTVKDTTPDETTAEPPRDEIETEVADIRGSFERIIANPQWMPGLRERIARLPPAERVAMEQLAKEAEEELAAARRQDDLPAGF